MSDLLERIKLSKYPSSVWLGKANGQEIIDLIEQQQARIAELEAKTSCCMGVGNGNGRLFVYGDHESIKTTQRYVLERDELAATVERLREQLSAMAAQHQCGCGHPACNRCGDDADNQEVLRATPEQNLNAVKREVAIDAFLKGAEWWAQCELNDTLYLDEQQASIDYANTKYPNDKDNESC